MEPDNTAQRIADAFTPPPLTPGQLTLMEALEEAEAAEREREQSE